MNKYSHKSSVTQTTMKLSVYLPAKATHGADSEKVPVLYFLSGLTCNEDNFITKAGAIAQAEKLGLCLVCPDTSPRTEKGEEIKGEHDNWDFGSGAGFYVNATTDLYSKHYNMYSYITQELVGLVNENLPVTGKQSVFGHSMGGHGACVACLVACVLCVYCVCCVRVYCVYRVDVCAMCAVCTVCTGEADSLPYYL